MICSHVLDIKEDKIWRECCLLQYFNNWKANNYPFQKIWPFCSLDFNPRDFFLWGHLKNLVYWGLLTSLEYLKDGIIILVKNMNKLFTNCRFYILWRKPHWEAFHAQIRSLSREYLLKFVEMHLDSVWPAGKCLLSVITESNFF